MTTPRPLVLVTRPADDGAALAERLERGGYEAMLAPVLMIEREELLDAAELDGVQAAVLTSARAAKAAAEDLDRSALAAVTAYCVGDATARAAEVAGFGGTVSAQGAAQDLVSVIVQNLDPAGGRLAVLRGRDAALDLRLPLQETGFTVTSHRLYRAEVAKHLPQRVVDAFVENRVAAVLLLSKRSARRFGELLDKAGIGDTAGAAMAVCISKDVADAAGMARFERLIASETPDLAATLRALDAALGGSASHSERLC